MPDGQRRLTLRVFCPRTGGTEAVETCETCELATEVTHTGEAEGWVTCGLPHTAAPSDTSAPRTVAEIARHGVSSVHHEAGQSLVWELLGEGGPRVLAVVDEAGSLRGWIRPTHRFAHLGTPGTTAGDLQTSAVTIEETAPARMALRQMATSRLREILVVSVEGHPVGLLTDLDALRFIGATRTPR